MTNGHNSVSHCATSGTEGGGHSSVTLADFSIAPRSFTDKEDVHRSPSRVTLDQMNASGHFHQTVDATLPSTGPLKHSPTPNVTSNLGMTPQWYSSIIKEIHHYS